MLVLLDDVVLLRHMPGMLPYDAGYCLGAPDSALGLLAWACKQGEYPRVTHVLAPSGALLTVGFTDNLQLSPYDRHASQLITSWLWVGRSHGA